MKEVNEEDWIEILWQKGGAAKADIRENLWLLLTWKSFFWFLKFSSKLKGSKLLSLLLHIAAVYVDIHENIPSLHIFWKGEKNWIKIALSSQRFLLACEHIVRKLSSSFQCCHHYCTKSTFHNTATTLCYKYTTCTWWKSHKLRKIYEPLDWDFFAASSCDFLLFFRFKKFPFINLWFSYSNKKGRKKWHKLLTSACIQSTASK